MDFDGITFESLSELIAFALITERYAYNRYRRDAADMQRRGDQTLAATFERLADEESRHVEELENFAAASDLDFDMHLAQLRFDRLLGMPKPQQRATDAPDAPLSPYAVLARAVNHEERAFHFYCQVAATATNDKMREYAEAFAHEELAHAALFRTERRKAYRRQAGQVDPPIDIATITDESALLMLALELETDLLSRIGDRPGELATVCSELVDTLRNKLYLAGEASVGPVSGPEYRLTKTSTTDDAALEALDNLFSVYDWIAHTSPVEAVAQRAQSLMSATLERIRLIA